MDDDEMYEDTICIVNYTESQKSIATTHVYSQELTDSSSGKESSRRTFLIEVDSDRSDAVLLAPASPAAPALSCAVSRAVSADLHTYSLLSHESFTQTSKTIIELAQMHDAKSTDTTAIETQTSQVSIVENKTIEYRIQVSGSQTRFSRHELMRASVSSPPSAASGWRLRAGTGADAARADSADDSEKGSSDTLRIVDDGPKPTDGNRPVDRLKPSDVDVTNKNSDSSRCDTGFDDSLEEDHANRDARDVTSERSITNSVDRDVEELYDKLEKSFDLRSLDRPDEFDIPRYISLTPLTEETTVKVDGGLEPARKECINTDRKEPANKHKRSTSDLLIKKPPGVEEDKKRLKLPPIQKLSCPDSWETRGAGLAAGEGANVCTRAGRPSSPHLPSIYLCGTGLLSRGDGSASPTRGPRGPSDPGGVRDQHETISIHNKIQQLKMPATCKKRMLYTPTTTGSRSSSPGSTSCAGAGASAAVTARGCEALCADIVARLRRHGSCTRPTFEVVTGARSESSDVGANWPETVALLEEIPVRFRGFWASLPEHRVADLLRLVTAQVESPRTRVARAACATLATILTHTNYTKKPDFMEAVTALLVKTGSCVRPLRRAANLALDAIMASVDVTHAVTALCVSGVEHKSPAVRSAAARLLVVAAALARGGRGLLRAQPASAAHARRLALRTLSALLQDRSRETRMYAERLYAMLRPLPRFEAFLLADVGARAACRLLGQFDARLPPAPPPPAPAPPVPPPLLHSSRRSEIITDSIKRIGSTVRSMQQHYY